MKKITYLLTILVLVASLSLFATGCVEVSDDATTPTTSATDDSAETEKVTNETVAKPQEASNKLGDYTVDIDSCRLAKDFEGEDVVIVKYIFSNVSNDDATAFAFAVDDTVYQDGVGLNEAYFLDDNANYSSDNSLKEIKAGASVEVEVAYKLNDSTTEIEVEVKELISFDDTVITKTFSLQ